MEKLKADCFREGERLRVLLRGSVDHHTLAPVRGQIDAALSYARTTELVLDLSGVEFMDSSGLGLILGRYARMSELGGHLVLCGVGNDIMRILRLAGADKFIAVEKSEKKPGA